MNNLLVESHIVINGKPVWRKPKPMVIAFTVSAVIWALLIWIVFLVRSVL